MKTIGLILLMIGMSLSVSAKEFKLHVKSDELIYGVIQRENPSENPNAVGDKHMRYKAYGLIQIRAPYLKDVNWIAGKKEIRRKWGKDRLTMADMKNREKAEWAFHVYLSHYGKAYTRQTGRIPTAEVYARIHNGGPTGWQDNKTKKSENTKKYAKAVVKFMREYHLMTEGVS